MTSWPWKARAANERPDLAAGCWDKLRQFFAAHATSDHSHIRRFGMLHFDVVVHGSLSNFDNKKDNPGTPSKSAVGMTGTRFQQVWQFLSQTADTAQRGPELLKRPTAGNTGVTGSRAVRSALVPPGLERRRKMWER